MSTRNKCEGVLLSVELYTLSYCILSSEGTYFSFTYFHYLYWLKDTRRALDTYNVYSISGIFSCQVMLSWIPKLSWIPTHWGRPGEHIGSALRIIFISVWGPGMTNTDPIGGGKRDRIAFHKKICISPELWSHRWSDYNLTYFPFLQLVRTCLNPRSIQEFRLPFLLVFSSRIFLWYKVHAGLCPLVICESSQYAFLCWAQFLFWLPPQGSDESTVKTITPKICDSSSMGKQPRRHYRNRHLVPLWSHCKFSKVLCFLADLGSRVLYLKFNSHIINRLLFT